MDMKFRMETDDIAVGSFQRLKELDNDTSQSISNFIFVKY